MSPTKSAEGSPRSTPATTARRASRSGRPRRGGLYFDDDNLNIKKGAVDISDSPCSIA